MYAMVSLFQSMCTYTVWKNIVDASKRSHAWMTLFADIQCWCSVSYIVCILNTLNTEWRFDSVVFIIWWNIIFLCEPFWLAFYQQVIRPINQYLCIVMDMVYTIIISIKAFLMFPCSWAVHRKSQIFTSYHLLIYSLTNVRLIMIASILILYVF